MSLPCDAPSSAETEEYCHHRLGSDLNHGTILEPGGLESDLESDLEGDWKPDLNSGLESDSMTGAAGESDLKCDFQADCRDDSTLDSMLDSMLDSRQDSGSQFRPKTDSLPDAVPNSLPDSMQDAMPDSLADSMPKVPKEEEVYEYYRQELLPALASSLPILASRLSLDAGVMLRDWARAAVRFLFPNLSVAWLRQWTSETKESLLAQYWRPQNAPANATFVDYLLEKLDANRDGHISAAEMLANAEDLKREVEALVQQYSAAAGLAPLPPLPQPPWLGWLEWLRAQLAQVATADRKLGAYLWHTCSGLILVLVVTSIVPGRLHGWTGRLLRFPVLALVYMAILVELWIYTWIRLAIRLAEILFANPRHRALRHQMATAKTYHHWYHLAATLDQSQGRDKWQRTVNDDTAYRYSWPFILELLRDLKASRQQKDVIMALAVLQQCTRKNVGGIMSEDMFSYTNCGEPKLLVSEFVEEVVLTLTWVTDQVRRPPPPSSQPMHASSQQLHQWNSIHSHREHAQFEQELKAKILQEQTKMYRSLISWATQNFLGADGEHKKLLDAIENVSHHSNLSLSTQSDSPSQPSPPHKHPLDAETTSSTPQPIPSLNTSTPQPNNNNNNNNNNDDDYAKQQILRQKIKTFLKRARAAYGRTALCLSGGAMMGNYHFGAVRALLETKLLPHIISGTSAGSVIGSMLCTRTEKELMRDLHPHILAPKMELFASSWMERIRRWFRYGTMFDQDDWYNRVRWFTSGDMTFEEAYKKTGRVLCITLSATSKKSPPVLINYITAPNVVIASAVLASAAVPGFVDPMRLRVKDENGVVRDRAHNDEEYRDGSIDCDIPTTGLAEMLNCQFFLAAQANPHIVPFFYNSKGDVGRPSRWSSGMRDDSWRGGFFLSAMEMYLKNDMKSKFNFLNDLEVALGFTSTMMTQNYSGTTTIVPQVCLKDFFLLFAQQSENDMERYFQGGSVAAYQHMAMLKLHYKIAYALDECLASLEFDESPNNLPRRRRSQLLLTRQTKSMMDLFSTSSSTSPPPPSSSPSPQGGIHFAKLDTKCNPSCTESDATTPSSTICDDEYEEGGFDGVECAFGPGIRPLPQE